MRVVGLNKAPHHNCKIGRVSAKPAGEGRVGVVLDDGKTTLAVRNENVELVAADKSDTPKPPEEPKSRTLVRDNAILDEFDQSRDPELLVLYHHLRDRSFDGFNSSEYHAQMLRYYAGGVSVVTVVPRRIRDNNYLLVCLANKKQELNTLCELSFLCMRQFVGFSMLVKKRCFVCSKPDAPPCACQCACFCSKECASRGRDEHEKLCKLVKASPPAIEAETVQLF